MQIIPLNKNDTKNNSYIQCLSHKYHRIKILVRVKKIVNHKSYGTLFFTLRTHKSYGKKGYIESNLLLDLLILYSITSIIDKLIISTYLIISGYISIPKTLEKYFK